MNSEVKLNNKFLDDFETFIVLEAGPTHQGLKSAKNLVKIAKDSGADSIKFQMADIDRLMADKSMNFSYKYLNITRDGKEEYKEIKEPLYDILKRRELSSDEWMELKSYCDDIGIHMFTTACFIDEIDFAVNNLKIDSIKIASSDIREEGLIKHAASLGITIQLDTGNSNLWEIEKAINIIQNEKNNNIIIHHCPSGYPAKLESINLNMISTLKKLFPEFIIAFSDHSPGWDMDIAAVSLGAKMIEKTITEDRTIKSCEHSFSLEKDQINLFIKSIRELEIALGKNRRVIPDQIMNQRKNTRRSPYAIQNLKKGERISEKNFDMKRPGNGIDFSDLKLFEGLELKKNIEIGDVLTKSHFL